MMCLGVELFEFILFGFHLALCMCRLMFFIKLAKFWVIIFFKYSSAPFSVSFETPIMHMLLYLVEEAKLSAQQGWKMAACFPTDCATCLLQE